MLTFAGVPLGGVDPAPGLEVGEPGSRYPHRRGDLVMEAKIFVDVGRGGLAGGDSPDDGGGAGDAVASGKHALQIRQPGV